MRDQRALAEPFERLEQGDALFLRQPKHFPAGAMHWSHLVLQLILHYMLDFNGLARTREDTTGDKLP